MHHIDRTEWIGRLIIERHRYNTSFHSQNASREFYHTAARAQVAKSAFRSRHRRVAKLCGNCNGLDTVYVDRTHAVCIDMTNIALRQPGLVQNAANGQPQR